MCREGKPPGPVCILKAMVAQFPGLKTMKICEWMAIHSLPPDRWKGQFPHGKVDSHGKPG